MRFLTSFLLFSRGFWCAFGSDSRALQQKDDQPELYRLSVDELLAYETREASPINADLERKERGRQLKKRGAPAAITCFNKNRFKKYAGGRLEEFEQFRWVSAQCVRPFVGIAFTVWCHVDRYDPVTGLWAHDRYESVPGSCGPDYFCVDIDAKFDGEGLLTVPNDVECRLRRVNPHWELEALALELNRLRELNRCTRPATVPGSDVASSSGQKRGRGRPRKTRTFWSVQMEVGLATGGDYHAKRLYIKDVTFPVPKEVKSRSDANVTHVEVTMFPEFGVHSRDFEFCIDAAKASPALENKWVILYHSIRDMSDDQGYGRIGHGSRRSIIEHDYEYELQLQQEHAAVATSVFREKFADDDNDDEDLNNNKNGTSVI